MNTAEKDVAMKEETKEYNLAYFEEQVAAKYKTFEDMCANNNRIMREAAKLYADYKYAEGYKDAGIKFEEYFFNKGFQEGKQEGEAKIAELSASLYKQGKRNGWNEALHWAAEETQIDFVVGNDLKQSILNGLKEE